MNFTVSPDDATRALREIDDSRAAMRRAIRAHRGHLHLWLWGSIWIAMALTMHGSGERGSRWLPVFVLPGVIASVAIGIYQARQIRVPIDRRFVGALLCVVGFGVVWGAIFGVFRPPVEDVRLFAFIALLVMQLYVLAGIWFDNYLLAIGLLVSVLILVGLFVVPEIFWLWFAIFCGGPVLLSGFLVRFWR
jgi:hypothetical protein